jgi:transcriptional regulator with XRE-family HTH domain
MRPVNSFLKGIGQALAYLRTEAGISQSALAKQLGKKIQPRISQMERGEIVPSGNLIQGYLTHCKPGEDEELDEVDLADAFLGADPSEEEILRRVLRTMRLGELPPRLEKLALEQLRTHRRTLQEAIGRPAGLDEG